MTSQIRLRITTAIAMLGACVLPPLLLAQEPPHHSPDQQTKAESTTPDELEAAPNRPSSSNSAEVLPPGVLQLEYGFAREWGTAGDRVNLLGGELRFGVWRNLEIRWGGNSLVNIATEEGHVRGFGDQYLSTQALLHEESSFVPALAVGYAIKFPTADESQGLGSGRTDHSFTFLASKDVHDFTLDFNASYQVIGREFADGHDQNALLILTVLKPLSPRLSLIGEISAETRLGDEAAAFATTLWALTYRLHCQVVIDAAFEAGITSGAPHKKILFGITYAIANLYPKRFRARHD